ncbi:AEC family transporter [Burkholderia sp. Bp9143]|uniref:AEC family transporter n=1 Tax=Burkholderia sp. Bp9143 TaxID=2184574 RepID=UPI000F5B1509|nr:AEC family transporter [Burkholderia sp. Bp9143]RQR24573.1 AEC family transporter [Burkholderia sp. Bp9143]
MLTILTVTGPIYLIIALGYVAGHYGVFSKSEIRVLGTFVVKFALPALIFSALSQHRAQEFVHWHYLLAYAIGSFVLMAAGFAWNGWRRRKGVTISALYALGMSTSNSGYVGYPIAMQVVGAKAAAVALASNLLVENLLMIPLSITLADSNSSTAGSWHLVFLESMRQLIRNPMIIAIIAGFCVALLGIPVGELFSRTVAMLAMSSTAVALFVIGGSLVNLSLAGFKGEVLTVSLCKLLLHPLAVGALAWLVVSDDPPLRAAATVYASAPMIGIYPILAQKYGQESFCAAVLLFATLTAFATITTSLYVLRSVLVWL